MFLEKEPVNIVIRRPSDKTIHAFASDGYIEPYYSIKFVGKPIITRIIEGATSTIEFLGGHYVNQIFIESEGETNEIRHREKYLQIYLRNKFPWILTTVMPKASTQQELDSQCSLLLNGGKLMRPCVVRGDEYLSPRLSGFVIRESGIGLYPTIEPIPDKGSFDHRYPLRTPQELRHASLWTAKDLSPAMLTFDLDGTLMEFHNRGDGGEPIQDAISVLRSAYNAGHRITIKTARGTHNGKRLGFFKSMKILREIKRDLDRLGVPWHEIQYGVTYADVYVDDFSFNPLYYSIDKATGFYFL